MLWRLWSKKHTVLPINLPNLPYMVWRHCHEPYSEQIACCCLLFLLQHVLIIFFFFSCTSVRLFCCGTFLQLKFLAAMKELRFLWRANWHIATLARIHCTDQLLGWLKSVLVVIACYVLFVYRFKLRLFSLHSIFSVLISKICFHWFQKILKTLVYHGICYKELIMHLSSQIFETCFTCYLSLVELTKSICSCSALQLLIKNWLV